MILIFNIYLWNLLCISLNASDKSDPLYKISPYYVADTIDQATVRGEIFVYTKDNSSVRTFFLLNIY